MPTITGVPPARQLTAALDGAQAEIRQRVRQQLQRPELAPAIALEPEAHRCRVTRQLGLLAADDSPARGFPAAYGGADDVAGGVAAFETLAFGDLSLLVKAGVQFGLFGGAIHHLGTAPHHQRYLPSVVDGSLPGCFAMTETAHGSDVQSVATTATYDPDRDELVVDTPEPGARKDYIGGAARDARMAVVFAQLHVDGAAHGVHAVLVGLRDDDGRALPGVALSDCGPKAGLNGVDNGRITFDGVRVPRTALLDRFGGITDEGAYTSPIASDSKRFFRMVGTLVQGRVSVSGAAISATKTALTIAVRYGLERRQFHPPHRPDEEVAVLDYRAHQRRLLPALATTYALSFAQHALTADLDRVLSRADPDDDARRELETRAAGLKAMSTWHATATIQACREACGGAGYLAVNRLPQLKADTDVFTTFEGDNTVLLQLVTKGLLTGYREQFDDLGSLGMARFVADQIAGTVAERIAVRPLVQSLIDSVGDDEEHSGLRERGWHCRMLTWREQHALESLVGRLKRGIADGADAFTAFNDCQDHVLLAARAHLDRVVLEGFIEAIAASDAATAQLLAQVCDLHALATIEAERAWFMEHNRLSAVRAKAVTDAVNVLCDELRPHAELLVDGFAVPGQAVAAPIALGDHTSPPPAPPA